MKECPICHEQIHDNAKVCKHCKEPINEWTYRLKPFLISHGALEKYFKKTAEEHFINLLKLDISISIGICVAFKLFERNTNIVFSLNLPIIFILTLFMISIFLAYVSIILLSLEYKSDAEKEAGYLRKLKELRKENHGELIDSEIKEITINEYLPGRPLQWRDEPIGYGVSAIIVFLIAIFLLPITFKETNQYITPACIESSNSFLILAAIFVFPIIFAHLVVRFFNRKILIYKAGDFYISLIFFIILFFLQFDNFFVKSICYFLQGFAASLALFLMNNVKSKKSIE